MGGAGVSAAAGASARETHRPAESSYNEHPLSSGPYVLEAWNHGSSLTFVPNARYFRGAPHAQRGDLESRSRRQHALQRVGDARDRRLPQRQRQRDRAPFVDLRQSSSTHRLMRELAPSRHQHEPSATCRRPSAPRDRAKPSTGSASNTTSFTISTGSRVSDIFPESWAAPGCRVYRYDPARRKRLLAAAGWRPGPDGILRKGPLSMHLTIYATTGHQENTESQVLIQSMLREVGIDVAVRNYPGSYLFAKNGPLYTGTLRSGVVDRNQRSRPRQLRQLGRRVHSAARRQHVVAQRSDRQRDEPGCGAARSIRTARKALYQREEERFAFSSPPSSSAGRPTTPR